jgi:hypothetical protein
MLEGRALLSALPVHHPQPPHATVLALPEKSSIGTSERVPTHHAGHAHPLFLKIRAEGGVHPLRYGGGGPPPSALTPAQVRHIYSIDQISNLGHNQTIAIVDAYDDPNIFNDADVFDRAFMTTLGGSTSYYTA